LLVCLFVCLFVCLPSHCIRLFVCCAPARDVSGLFQARRAPRGPAAHLPVGWCRDRALRCRPLRSALLSFASLFTAGGAAAAHDRIAGGLRHAAAGGTPTLPVGFIGCSAAHGPLQCQSWESVAGWRMAGALLLGSDSWRSLRQQLQRFSLRRTANATQHNRRCSSALDSAARSVQLVHMAPLITQQARLSASTARNCPGGGDDDSASNQSRTRPSLVREAGRRGQPRTEWHGTPVALIIPKRHVLHQISIVSIEMLTSKWEIRPAQAKHVDLKWLLQRADAHNFSFLRPITVTAYNAAQLDWRKHAAMGFHAAVCARCCARPCCVVSVVCLCALDVLLGCAGCFGSPTNMYARCGRPSASAECVCLFV
jgi:hypothetical protein